MLFLVDCSAGMLTETDEGSIALADVFKILVIAVKNKVITHATTCVHVRQFTYACWMCVVWQIISSPDDYVSVVLFGAKKSYDPGNASL